MSMIISDDISSTGILNRKTRLVAFDIARAFAIILVVIGHWNPADAPVGWNDFVKWIYTFHMPLFLFISGYLFSRSDKSYKALLISKIKRLLIPYLTVSIIIITIKLLTSGNLSLENPVSAMSYIEILWKPSAGYFLWFIWTLWWCFCIVPLFKTRNSRILLCCLCIVFSYIPLSLPDVFCLNETKRMMMWFIIGVLVMISVQSLLWIQRRQQFVLPHYL